MNQHNNKSLLKSLLQIPWTTRAYFITLIALSIIDILYEKWSYIHLQSNFVQTILEYQVWRGLLNFLYQPNIIILVLIIFHLAFYLSKFERQNGSIITFYEIITIGLLIQFMVLSYETLIYFLKEYQFIEGWKFTYNIGAAGPTINIMMKFLYFNFKEENRKCSLRAVFAVLYPLLLVVLGTVISEQYRIDMIAGYVLGLIQCLIFKGGILFYTPDTYTEKEKLIYCCRLPRIPCCNWSNLNENKIKPNRLCVVEARQFYILNQKAYQNPHIAQVGGIELQEGIQTQRGSFRRGSNRMIDDQMPHEGRGQKWQKPEIIEDQ